VVPIFFIRKERGVSLGGRELDMIPSITKGVLLMARVVLFELSSQNPERAVQFYSTVFGWNIAEPRWDYYAVTTGSDDRPGINGGIDLGPPDYPHGTRIIIEVDSIEEAIAKSVENGANIVREPMDFDDFHLAYLVDPTGLGFGLIQYKS
jgi:uncharacterized protein